MPEAPEGDFTVKQFARLTHQTEQSVYRKCRSGEIPSYKIGSSVRIRREDVEAVRRPRHPQLDPALREKIRIAVEGWPPLTPEQREAVAALFAQPERGDLHAC